MECIICQWIGNVYALAFYNSDVYNIIKIIQIKIEIQVKY